MKKGCELHSHIQDKFANLLAVGASRPSYLCRTFAVTMSSTDEQVGQKRGSYTYCITKNSESLREMLKDAVCWLFVRKIHVVSLTNQIRTVRN